MIMKKKKKNDKHVGRQRRQKSCKEQSAENDNSTEETQLGPASTPPDTGTTNCTGNNSNKQIR